MSHYMTALAMRQTGLKPAAKIVLYWLADHHNESTGDCFPSINRLAELCEMSRRSVENHLADLEAANLVERAQRYRETGGKTSNGYMLRLAESDAQNLRMGCAKAAHGDAQKLRMNNLVNINLGKEPSFLDCVSVFDAFNEIAEKTGWPTVQKKSPARERLAKARMKDCGGFENWLRAIQRAADSDFLSGRKTGTTPASFDWLNTASNFTKVMEGNYDNRTDNRPGTSGPSRKGGDRIFDEIARAAGLGQTQGAGGF